MSLVIAIIVAWIWLDPPWNVLVVVGAGAFEAFEVWLFFTLRNRRSITGATSLIGTKAVAVTDLDPEGQVRARGQFWKARAASQIKRGDAVLVEEVEGLVLHVRPVALDGLKTGG